MLYSSLLLFIVFLLGEARGSRCWQESVQGTHGVMYNGSELAGKEAWRVLEMEINKRNKGIRGLNEVVKAVDIC